MSPKKEKSKKKGFSFFKSVSKSIKSGKDGHTSESDASFNESKNVGESVTENTKEDDGIEHVNSHTDLQSHSSNTSPHSIHSTSSYSPSQIRVTPSSQFQEQKKEQDRDNVNRTTHDSLTGRGHSPTHGTQGKVNYQSRTNKSHSKLQKNMSPSQNELTQSTTNHPSSSQLHRSPSQSRNETNNVSSPSGRQIPSYVPNSRNHKFPNSTKKDSHATDENSVSKNRRNIGISLDVKDFSYTTFLPDSKTKFPLMSPSRDAQKTDTDSFDPSKDMKVRLELLKGRDLPKCEGPLAKADPYCIVSLWNKQKTRGNISRGVEMVRSKVQKKTLNPIFNETFEFIIKGYKTSYILIIDVIDWKKGGNGNEMGSVIVDLQNMESNRVYQFSEGLDVPFGKKKILKEGAFLDFKVTVLSFGVDDRQYFMMDHVGQMIKKGQYVKKLKKKPKVPARPNPFTYVCGIDGDLPWEPWELQKHIVQIGVFHSFSEKRRLRQEAMHQT